MRTKEEVRDRMKAILREQETLNRDLENFDQRKWDDLNVEYSELEKELHSMRSLYEPIKPDPSDDGTGHRSIERRDMVKYESSSRHFAPISNPDTETRAYSDFLRTGETRGINGMYVDSDVSGGFVAVPEAVASNIIAARDNAVFIRKFAQKFTIKADSQGLPTLDTDISDPTWKGEIQEADYDEDMSHEKRLLTPHRLTNGIKVSRKLLRLSTTNYEAFVRRRLTYKNNVVEEANFMGANSGTLGDGAGKPLGLFTSSDLGISSSRNVSAGNTASSIKYDGLVNALYNLKAPYLESTACRWIFHRNTIKMIRKLKDGEGSPLWQPSMIAGEPAQILGVPVIQSEYAPDIDTASSGDRVGLIGDLSYYGVADSEHLYVAVLKEKYAEKDQIAYLIQSYTDGAPLLEEAFSMVTLG